jgi:hypothetical protein
MNTGTVLMRSVWDSDGDPDPDVFKGMDPDPDFFLFLTKVLSMVQRF